MYAEHIIGLTAKEQVRPDDPDQVSSVFARYRAIRAAGVLREKLARDIETEYADVPYKKSFEKSVAAFFREAGL